MARYDGTTMYCPHCKSNQKCTADTLEPHNRNFNILGVQYFHRWRKCDECKKSWQTAEVREDVLDELISAKSRADRYEKIIDQIVKAVAPVTKRRRQLIEKRIKAMM